ncbi:HsdR family type I site-specific deoxyribonuclease [Phormidium sp. FACHB-1136]|uniref:type I restriction endonuclease subunit R n=1 Tax=Phormidium sp. FACHB-1136 TaxID=2692848 RepID=UPI001686419D|nr:HsdR family type I site-specific deoxyribonuclease [Phormidium sp. FACHB-1136]MBD2427584.1 type I restriction endonuclease subunit R [Phormidium sp. FACHB-1136]
MTPSPSFIPENTPPFSEDDVSKIPAVALLMKLGYQYLLPKETLALRGGRRSSVILYGVLEQQLRNMNRIQFRGEEIPFTEGNIAEAIRVLRDMEDDGLVRTNEKLWDLLRLGKALPQTIQGDTKSFTLHYIDWDRPENNVYHVTDEFVVEANGTTTTRRPDIVLFVNGIPFCIIECKCPGLPAGRNPIEEAIDQQISNQQTSEIPRLFHYAQLLLVLAMNAASYGATGTPKKFWSVWKERHLDEAALQKIVNQPLSDALLAHLFTSDQYRLRGSTPEQARQWFETLQTAGRSVTAQDMTLYALCRPERLLELADRFTIFDAGERKIARYQQYFCVKRILERIHTFDAEGARQGGVVWHTQGSGKSITMVLLAEAIARDPAIQDPKIILVTDRVDLDDQIYRTFDHCGVDLVQARTGTHLQELLKDPKARIITTLINKFQAIQDETNDNPNIFALVDESHRTQFGTLHTAMRRVLTRACLIGFTGTPLWGKDKTKNTMAKFGGLIDRYTIGQAVPDGAVLPLLYEGRHVPQEVDRKQIDLWFKRYTAGLTDQQQADLKRKFSTAEQLNQTEQKVRAIAWDISHHYSTEWQKTGLKAQLVTPSKAAALLYKRFLDEFGKVTSEVLISPPDTREGSTDIDELQDDDQRPKIQAFWKQIIERYGSEDRYQKDLINRFKHGDEPEIIIVVDKLITGFDAPRNTVLYLARSLKDHRLLQAIARVNRLLDGKDFGYIIDYYGVLKRLGKALDLYSSMEDEFDPEDLENTLTDVSEEWRKLEQRHSDLWEIFQGVKNKQDVKTFLVLLADEDLRSKFYERLSLFARTLKIALASLEFYDQTPETKINRYKTDLKFFIGLKAESARHYAECVDFKQYQGSIQKLLDTHVGTDEVETVVEPVNIFDKEAFQAEIDAQDSSITKAERIANRTKRAITERLEEDPAFYTPFSKMLDDIIQSIRAHRFDDAEALLKHVEEIRDKVRDRTGDDIPDRLRDHDVAKAYYGVVQENLAGIGSIYIPSERMESDDQSQSVQESEGEYRISRSSPKSLKELSVDIALRIESIVNEHRIVNWTQNIDVQNRMKTIIEDMLFEIQDEYDFELHFDTIDIILEKCVDIARVRVP